MRKIPAQLNRNVGRLEMRWLVGEVQAKDVKEYGCVQHLADQDTPPIKQTLPHLGNSASAFSRLILISGSEGFSRNASE